MKKFCHHCGKPLVGAVKFCPECGTNLSSLSSTPESAKSTFTPIAVNEDDDDVSYIDRIDHLTRIKNLRLQGFDVDIVKDRPQGETIGAIAAQVQANGGPIVTPDDKVPRAMPAQVSKEEFLAAFREEAGTKRQD